MKKIHVLHLAGYGDCLSFITRIPAIKRAYPDYELKFYVGGYGRSARMCQEQFVLEGYEAMVIKNLTFHSQLPKIREIIKQTFVKTGDLFFDASFCDEIFSNQEPWFWKYDMEIPYVYAKKSCIYGKDAKVDAENEARHEEILDIISSVPKGCKLIAMQPLTKSGNAEGFDHDLKAGRFWSQVEWEKLYELLHMHAYIPVFVGMGDEDWGLVDCAKGLFHAEYKWWKTLPPEDHEKYYSHPDYIDFRNRSVEDTINLLQRVDAGVFCNSWSWEITSRSKRMIPTYCFFTKNHFFIQNHIPNNNPEYWDHTFIQTHTNVRAEDVFEHIEYMVENKKKPDIKYSVGMITYRDEDTLEKTLINIEDKSEDIVVVHGDGENGTFQNILNFRKNYVGWDNIYIHMNPWPEDFGVQKSLCIEKCSNEWIVWIDADETYENLFWQQLPWYIWIAEKNGVDCISVPRINIIENMNPEELAKYAQRNGWRLSGFNWVNYPDYQRRVFKKQCRFVGKTHEQLVGWNNEMQLVGVHCIHTKSKERQEIGFEREQKQYMLKAQEVKRLIYDS